MSTQDNFKLRLLQELGHGQHGVHYEVFDSVRGLFSQTFETDPMTYDFVFFNNCLRKSNGLIRSIFKFFPGSERALLPESNVKLGSFKSFRSKQDLGLTVYSVFSQVCFGHTQPHETSGVADEHLSIAAFEKGLRSLIANGAVRKGDMITLLFPGYDSNYAARWSPYHDLLESMAAHYGITFRVMVSELQLVTYPIDRLDSNLTALREAYGNHSLEVSRSTQQFINDTRTKTEGD